MIASWSGELPSEIEKLGPTLEELYLDENAFTSLPACLSGFRCLPAQ